MLNTAAQNSNLVQESIVISVKCITSLAIRRKGCQNKWMCQRKLTRRRFSTSQDAIEMSAEAYMRPENAL
jgi:hypothetical protein